MSARQTGKSDRRSGPIGSDRRAERRRTGDKLGARLADDDASRKRAALRRDLRSWSTSKLIKRLVQNAFAEGHLENDLISAELDARMPPRSP